jgi:hypothetical protein
MASSTSTVEDADPPSYDEVTSAIDSKASNSIRSKVQNQVRYELSNLDMLLASAQRQRQEDFNQDDEEVLDFLLPRIKDFLYEFSRTTFRKATFIIIPYNAVDPLASPCDEDLRSAEEYGHLLRIIPAEKEETIWEDREKVERLASYLQPENEAKPDTTVQLDKPQSPSKPSAPAKRSFFKRTSRPRNQKSEEPKSSFSPREKMPRSNVSMTVKGEEVVFRLENSLGLYETQSAWGLIIKLQVTA